MSVWGGLEREKEENSKDFYEYLQQRGCRQKRGNCGAKQWKGRLANNVGKGRELSLRSRSPCGFKKQACRNMGVKN